MHLSFPFQPHHNRIPIYMYPNPLDLARNITKFVNKLTKNGRTTSLDINLLDIIQVCKFDSNTNKSFRRRSPHQQLLPFQQHTYHTHSCVVTNC